MIPYSQYFKLFLIFHYYIKKILPFTFLHLDLWQLDQLFRIHPKCLGFIHRSWIRCALFQGFRHIMPNCSPKALNSQQYSVKVPISPILVNLGYFHSIPFFNLNQVAEFCCYNLYFVTRKFKTFCVCFWLFLFFLLWICCLCPLLTYGFIFSLLVLQNSLYIKDIKLFLKFIIYILVLLNTQVC